MKIKSFDRREELMEAALDEFAAKSYEEASLNNIIKNAGISKGTFYYHYEDKQALYLSLLQSMANAKVEFVERKMQDYDRNEDLNLFESLKLQARSAIEFARIYPRYYPFALMFLKEKGNRIYGTAMDMLGGTSEKYFEELLEKAMLHGDIKPGITKPFAAKIVAYLLTRYDELFDIKRATELDFDHVLRDIDILIDFMQYGLGSNRPNNG
ncbi:MAG TPA: TetR/AcrR family transcriptional regulator [Anaerovoracaceae bacterium]|nr:TetR/AcrR family transcriptional regulator [Anaerovoracaceae bacterium]